MADALKSTIEKLALGTNDLLIFHVHPDDDAIGVGNKLRKMLSKRGIENVIVVCREGTTVEQLDPDAMAQRGWYRKATKRTEA